MTFRTRVAGKFYVALRPPIAKPGRTGRKFLARRRKANELLLRNSLRRESARGQRAAEWRSGGHAHCASRRAALAPSLLSARRSHSARHPIPRQPS